MSSLIQHFNESTGQDYIPDEISNRIYYSKTFGDFGPINYKTSFTIKYAKVGGEYYKTEGAEHHLKDNQYLVLNSGNDVSCYAGKIKHVMEGMSVFLDDELIRETVMEHKNPELLFELDRKANFEFHEFSNYCNNQVGHFLTYFFDQVKLAHTVHKQINIVPLRYRLAELLVENQVELNGQLRSIPRVKRTVKLEIIRKLGLVREYLQENYSAFIRLEDVSKIAGLSKYYMIKCFNQVYGRTPYDYVIKLRLGKAKEELEAGEKSITTISIENGFTDLSSFSKKFKAEIGMSPKEYQKWYGIL